MGACRPCPNLFLPTSQIRIVPEQRAWYPTLIRSVDCSKTCSIFHTTRHFLFCESTTRSNSRSSFASSTARRLTVPLPMSILRTRDCFLYPRVITMVRTKVIHFTKTAGITKSTLAMVANLPCFLIIASCRLGQPRLPTNLRDFKACPTIGTLTGLVSTKLKSAGTIPMQISY